MNAQEKWLSLCADMPSTPGVYCVWSDGRPLYIGTSNELKKRFRNHVNRFEFLLRGADRITWQETPAESFSSWDERNERYAMERWMIRKHDPPMNRRKRDFMSNVVSIKTA